MRIRSSRRSGNPLVQRSRINAHRVGAEDALNTDYRAPANQNTVLIEDVDVRAVVAVQRAHELRLTAIRVDDVVERDSAVEVQRLTHPDVELVPIQDSVATRRANVAHGAARSHGDVARTVVQIRIRENESACRERGRGGCRERRERAPDGERLADGTFENVCFHCIKLLFPC